MSTLSNVQTPTLKNTQALLNASSSGIFGVAAVDANNFYCAYINGDGEVKVSAMSRTSPSASWSQTDVSYPNALGSHSPALVMYQGKLMLVYRMAASGGDDENMVFAQKDDSKDDGWAGPYYIQDMQGGSGDAEKDTHAMKGKARGKTDHRPAICVLGNNLWVIDKNNGKHFIAECVFNGSSWSSNNNQTMWQSGDEKDEQQKDWGYLVNPPGNDEDDLYIRNQIQAASGNDACNPQTPRNPSTAELNGKMYVAYKGGVYASDGDEEKMYIMSTSGGFTWANPVQLLDGYESKYAPAITACNGYLVCVFSNHDHSDNLYQSIGVVDSHTGSITWSAPTQLIEHAPHGSAGDPELVALSNGLVALSYRDSSGNATLCTLDFN